MGNVTVRRIGPDDGDGPYAAGAQRCLHIRNEGSLGAVCYNENSCPICRGGGWALVPVVLTLNKSSESSSNPSGDVG